MAKGAKGPAKKKISQPQKRAGTKPRSNGKHPGGRPPVFDEPKTMAEKIEAYFADLGPKGTKAGQPPTIAGLALALGFLDRKSITHYSEKEEFFPVVKAARLRIEAFHEGRLSGTAPVGSIFWLKNHSEYSDRQELTGANGGPLTTATAELSGLSPSEVDSLLAALAKVGAI